MRAERTFPSEPASVPAVRRFVASSLDYLGESVLDRVRLAVSELATNALLHAHTDFAVCAEEDGGSVYVAVTDSGPGSPSLRDPAPDPTSLHGRGLLIVEQLADEWGVEQEGHRKTVWFRLGAGRPPEVS